MENGPRTSLARHFQTLFGTGSVAGLTDGQLIERFLAGRDEASEVAFNALVVRHGPMVLGVCRRALSNPDDVADAFQATFLILVRKARSVRVEDSLGRWLYGVSRRVASRSRAIHARRPHAVASLDRVAARITDPDRFEWETLLDEELARLPEVYRAAIVLCDLGGCSIEEAARTLACPVGTIKSRLARGRQRLRERLERRGVEPSSFAVAPIVPPTLATATVRSAMVFSMSGTMPAGVVSVSALSLTREVLRTMSGFQIKMVAAAMMSLGIAATGVGVVARGQVGDKAGRTDGGDPPTSAQAAPVQPAGRPNGHDREPGAMPPREGDKVSMPQYVVEPPDVLLVEVLMALPGRPITGEHLVRPDGRIGLGFYGEVHVAGLTIPEIKEKVALHLREFLDDDKLGLTRIDPETGRAKPVEPRKSVNIFIDVASYNSKFYYVQGDVSSPGRLPITGNDTVIDAINFAGGLILSGSETNIRLVRPAGKEPGRERILPVDLAAIVDRGDPKTNYQLFPGDRLVVSRLPKPIVADPPKSEPITPEAIEERLRSVERKLDEIIERLPKP